jgi:hypothetical protein
MKAFLVLTSNKPGKAYEDVLSENSILNILTRELNPEITVLTFELDSSKMTLGTITELRKED